MCGGMKVRVAANVTVLSTTVLGAAVDGLSVTVDWGVLMVLTSCL